MMKVSLLACIGVAAATLVPLASGGSAGTLTFQIDVRIQYPPTACPAGTATGLVCFSRTGIALVRGLGLVNEKYAYVLDEYSPGCQPGFVRGLPSTAQLVADKGTINVSVSGTECLARVPPEPVRGTETFTVIGGSGRYVGASGSGMIAHVSNGPPGWTGTDTWTGTLTVPGLEFDLTPPTISGSADKVVRVPRYKIVRISRRKTKRVPVKYVRVRYGLSAADAVDGGVPVKCEPTSGSRFKVGRTTTVACTATDTSANIATAEFTVTVTRRR